SHRTLSFPPSAEVTCPRPPSIANGLPSGHPSGSFSRGVTVSYSCRPGFELLGNASVTCADSGLWSRPLNGGCRRGLNPPVQHHSACLPLAPRSSSELNSHFPPAVRPCPMPPEVANGKHNGQDKAFFTAGMAVRYSCDPGYYLVGNAAVSCRASGNWSQPRPRCEGESGLCPSRAQTLCGSEQETLRLLVGCRWQYLGFDPCVLPKCDMREDGAELAPQNHFSQTLMRFPPPCAEVTCPRPPSIANGLPSGHPSGSFSRGVTVSYSCRPGQGRALCVRGPAGAGSLKDALTAPAAIGCQAPEVQNGKVHNVQSTYRAGETLHFDCHLGYAAEGSDEARCQPGGTWDPPVLVCQRGDSFTTAPGEDLSLSWEKSLILCNPLGKCECHLL
uniref:Sushi domain-containing protein n=1 Tax=Taeniopygia guttata TaxID=59729 RepID=A0A674GI92_TAEGU